MSRSVVLLNGDWDTAKVLRSDYARDYARKHATEGAVAQVFTLKESEYYAPNFDKKAPQ